MGGDEENFQRKPSRDEEFDPDAQLGTKTFTKASTEDNDFDREVRVNFNKDAESYPAHELKEMKKTEGKTNMNVYGTI